MYLMSAAAMLFATSCESDADVAPNAGEASVVTFSVGTPEIVSRAYSDGLTATVLQYAVYDAAGNELTDLTVTNGEINGSANVQLQLTTGNTYSVIFWAAAPEAPYTVNFATKTMTVNYEGATCNAENRDAFYKYHTFTVNGTQTETIELKRPFAQLNIGTADYAASASAGYTPTQSLVKVPVYTTLNLKDGTVDGQATQTFALADIKKNETFPVAGNEYLAMSYLLVSKDKELVEVEFTYTDGTNAKTRKVGSVPVQRNYRTNLYGNIITSDVDINVAIAPEYDGEFDNEGYFIEENGANGAVTAVVESVNGLATIAAKINDGVLPSNTNVALKGDIDLADLAEVMRSGAVVSNWTPIGTGSENPFTGTFDGKGYTIKNFSYIVTGEKEAWYVGIFGFAKDATIKNLVMENVTIYSENAYFAEVGAVVGHLEGTSILENITIKGDVKIEGNVNHGEVSRIGAVVGGNYNGKITVKNVHVNATEGSYVKGNSHIGGIAGQLQEANIFENCSSNVDVTAGKFFAGGIIGCAGQYDTYTNCHTTGDIAVVAGRAGNANDLYRVGGIAGGWSDDPALVLTVNKCSYTGTISGKDAEDAVAEAFDCFGYVGRGYGAKVGSTVVIDGNVFVYSGNGIYTINGLTPVATADELVAALAANEGVIMTNDLKDVAVRTKAPYGNWYGVNLAGGVLDGNGHTLDFEVGPKNNDDKSDNYGIMTSGGTIKNVTIGGVFRGIMIMNPTQDVVIDNVTIVSDYWDLCYAINTGEGNGEHSLVVTNSDITGWHSYGSAIKDVTFKNCKFGQGIYYNDVFGRIVKPYVNALFENCEFISKYYIDLSELGEKGERGDNDVVDPNAKITLKNCTVNGVKLTKDNWASLIVDEDHCGEGQISIELKDGSYLTAENVVDYVIFE